MVFPFNWCANARSSCAASFPRAVFASITPSAWMALAMLLIIRRSATVGIQYAKTAQALFRSPAATATSFLPPSRCLPVLNLASGLDHPYGPASNALCLVPQLISFTVSTLICSPVSDFSQFTRTPKVTALVQLSLKPSITSTASRLYG